MTETQAENIYTAINKIMGQVGYIKKQRSPNLNYTYAGEAALIAALRPEMQENGVFVHVADVRNITTREYQTQKGTQMVNVQLTAVIRFYHAPSQTYIDAVACGEGSDTGDKATNKAMTGAYKYALRQTFCIETGDDPDRFQPEPKSNGKAQAEPDQSGDDDSPAEMTLPTARAFTTSSGKPLGDMTWSELEAMKKRADAVPQLKRGENWAKSFTALSVVMREYSGADKTA